MLFSSDSTICIPPINSGKKKSLPRTPKVPKFCLSNELSQRSRHLLGLCIMQGLPRPRCQNREMLYPTHLLLKNELPPKSPASEECSLCDVFFSRVSSASTKPDPRVPTAEIRSCWGENQHNPPPNPQEMFKRFSIWASDYSVTEILPHFPGGPDRGGSRQAPAMQKPSFASSVPNICTQGSRQRPGSSCWPAKPFLFFLFFFFPLPF